MGTPVVVFPLSAPVEWDTKIIGELSLKIVPSIWRGLRIDANAPGSFEPYDLASRGVRAAGLPEKFIEKIPDDLVRLGLQMWTLFLGATAALPLSSGSDPSPT